MVRLPKPGEDTGQWGGILNDFLLEAHNDDGSLRNGSVTASQLAPNAVTSTSLAVSGGSDGDVLTKDTSKTAGVSWKSATDDATASAKGVLQLTGDLGGTADAPTVPGLAAKADTAALAPVATSGSYNDLTDTPQGGGFDYIGSTVPPATQNTTSPTATFSETFEGGIVGTQPNATNTSYDTTIGDSADTGGNVSVVFDANGLYGQCAKFWNTATTGSVWGFLGKNLTPLSGIYLRRYVKIDVQPQYRTSFLLYKYGGISGSHYGSVAIGGSGQSYKFVLVNVDANATTSTTAVPIGAWFRVEVHVDVANSLQTLRIFVGSNLHGTTPDETISAPLPAGTGTVDYIEDGILTSPNLSMNVWMDNAVNDTTWPGPVASGPREGSTWLQTSPGGGKTPTNTSTFEAGNTSEWTFVQGATVDHSYAYRGLYGCRLAPDSANSNYSCLTWGTSAIPQGHPWATINFRFRYVQKTAPSKTYTNVFEIGNTATQAPKGQFTVYTNQQALVMDFNSADVVTIDPNPSVGMWHLIEARVFFGATTFQAYVRYDGRLLPVKISQNTQTAVNVSSLWVGYPSTATDQTIDVDDIRLWVGDTDGGFLDTQPPVIRSFTNGAWV